MTGIPNVKQIRSISRYGISAVTVIFNDDVPSTSRANLSERLSAANESIPRILADPKLDR